MMIVAQLGNNEQVLPLHVSSSNQLLYALTYGFLIAIHFGIINMLQARHRQKLQDEEMVAKSPTVMPCQKGHLY